MPKKEYRIIETTYWGNDKDEKKFYVQRKKKFLRWTWWSTISENIGSDCVTWKDFSSQEKAQNWITRRTSWENYYGDINVSTKVVKEIA